MEIKHSKNETVDPEHFAQFWSHEEDSSCRVIFDDGTQFTVCHRRTGFGFMDTETGYRDPDGTLWLAMGHIDTRRFHGTYGEAVEWLKGFARMIEPYKKEEVDLS